MSTTLSPTGLIQPVVGASANDWGDELNANEATVNGWFDAGPALKVANGGTGATTAAGARTNLGAFPLVGTTAADNAAAGQVGEYITNANYVGAAVGLTSGVADNISPAIGLSAGDWDVWANAIFNVGSSCTLSSWTAWLSSISATQPTAPDGGLSAHRGNVVGPFALGAAVSISPVRFNISSSGIVYLSAVATHTGGGTLLAYGRICARRVR